MDIEKLDLIHRAYLAAGPQVEKDVLQKLLLITMLLSDREIGDELMKVLRKL